MACSHTQSSLNMENANFNPQYKRFIAVSIEANLANSNTLYHVITISSLTKYNCYNKFELNSYDTIYETMIFKKISNTNISLMDTL